MKLIRDIIEENPLAAGIMAVHIPDLWQNLHQPLAEIGIDTAALKESIKRLEDIPDEPDWSAFSVGQMIFYLQNTHHFYAKVKIPQLDALLERLDNIPNYRKLVREFRNFKARTLKHILLEDEIVFPWLLSLEKSFDDFQPDEVKRLLKLNSVEILCHDHKEDDDVLKELRKLTNKYRILPHYPLELKVFYAELERMEYDLKRHAQLEDHILFEKAQKLESLLREKLM